jgi:6-phosphogluconate dehydrogenase
MASGSTSLLTTDTSKLSRIGLIGLAVMGQNLALNIAEKGFPISVWNRSPDKTEATVARAHKEKLQNLRGYKDLQTFVKSIQQPRAVIILIQAGKPVDEAIEKLSQLLDKGDIIVDGGNEWYTNTERRGKAAAEKGLLYMGMGVSGGEEGARHGPSLMPGGPMEAYKILEPILVKVAAQVNDGPCVTYIGQGGAGNYVKMIHNGIEYGDMQLIAEAYDLLKNVGGLTNPELAATFTAWNKSELESFLIEITAIIFKKKDEDGKGYVVDKILDKTGSKGTGKWTVQEAAEQAVPCPTMSAALDARYLSAMKAERVVASQILSGPEMKDNTGKVSKDELVTLVRQALYAAKICSYAQGMNLIREAGKVNQWNLNLGAISRIWKGGCIIRAVFLDRIKAAYDRNAGLANLLVDPEFAKELGARQAALRQIVTLAVGAGISVPAFSGSLAYYDSYRRASLPANLTQAQRDLFGAHTYERTDKKGAFHTEWLQ